MRPSGASTGKDPGEIGLTGWVRTLVSGPILLYGVMEVRSLDFERDKREEELRREAGTSGPANTRLDAEGQGTDGLRVDAQRAGSGALRVERVTEDAARRGALAGTKEALEEKEEEESGGGGLYGSQIDASHIVGAAIAEVVGTFILVFGGTAVAVGAILSHPMLAALLYNRFLAQTEAPA